MLVIIYCWSDNTASFTRLGGLTDPPRDGALFHPTCCR